MYHDYGGFLSAGQGDVTRGLEYAKRAQAILDREAKENPDDTHVFDLTLQTLTTLGMLQEGDGLIGSAGTVQEGLDDLNRALHMTERALERAPSDARLRYRLATVEMAIGESLLKLGNRPDALTHYRRAIDVFDALVSSGLSLPAAINRAVAYTKIGDLLVIESRPAEAVSYYEEGLTSISRIAADEPHNESVLRLEAIAASQLGHALVEVGKTEGGMPLLLKAVTKVEADATATPLARSIEALVRGWYGEALERQGKIGDAGREYALTKERIESVRASGIDYPRLRGFLGAASNRLAATFVKRGDLEAATRELESTRKLLEPLVVASADAQEIAYVLAETYTAEGSIAASHAARARDRGTQLATWREASASFRKSLAIWNGVPHPARVSTSGFEVTLPQEVSARLERSDREIRRLGPGQPLPQVLRTRRTIRGNQAPP